MRNLIFFTLLALCCGCKICQKGGGSACKTPGTVRDFTGLDGCGMLIELENGDKLLPAKMPAGFTLRDGQKIKFGYKELPGMVSICMAEKAAVEVTCIEEASAATTGGSRCADTMNPFSVDWMNKAFDKLNPTQIIKYRMDGGEWGYLFYAIPTSNFFGCRGNLVCQTKTGSKDECFQKNIAPLGRGKIIWQGEGVWD